MCAKKWEEKVFETLGNGTDGGRFPTRESSHDQAAANLQVLPTWYIWIEKIFREEVLPSWYIWIDENLREEVLPTWYIWIEKNLREETPTENEDQIIIISIKYVNPDITKEESYHNQIYEYIAINWIGSNFWCLFSLFTQCTSET